MKITTISALIYESKLALQGDLNFYSQIPNSCPVELPKNVEVTSTANSTFFLDIVQNIKNHQKYTFSVLEILYLFEI